MKEYVDPGLSVPEIAWALHRQGALVIACYPHHTTNSREDTLYLWDHHRWLAGLFDAWEIANNEDLFTQVSLKGFNYLANSDFHEPHHLYSWKTIIKAEKSSEVIKAAIRENRGVAIYRYRNNHLPSRSRQILSSLNPSLTAT